MLVLCIYEELQTIVFLAQVLQQNPFRFSIGLFHVIDEKLREVARYYPSRMFRERHVRHITLSLLERIEYRTVTLYDTLTQVLSQRLLFYQYPCRWDMSIDEVGLINFYLFFIDDKL